MRHELNDLLCTVQSEPAVQVIVLHGAGKGFSAGVDLKEPSDKESWEVLESEFRPFLECIWNSPKLHVAAVHGHAAGIAAALALACDLVVMEDSARLSLSFAAIGLIPDGGLIWHLTHTLGPKRALEAIVEGQQLDAALCMSGGIVNRIVETGQSVVTAQTWAAELANCAPLAMATAKQLIRASALQDLGETFSNEARAQTALVKSNDHKRAVEAFFKGEPPKFEGR